MGQSFGMRPTPSLIGTCLALLAGGLPGEARALDGVVEINQAATAAGGITPGDAAGFPVTLSVSGSYRLTGNVRLFASRSATTDGIVVTAADVTIDLNGFTLFCEASQLGNTVPCSQAIGTAVGIHGLAENVTVRNGVVRGWSQEGVLLGSKSLIEELRVLDNGTAGVTAEHSVIQNVVASNNGGDGIVGRSSVIQGCGAFENGDDGIWAVRGTVVLESNSIGNAGNGVRANLGSSLLRNNLRQNSGFGLQCDDSDVSYQETTITANSGGTASALCLGMGTNACNGLATCP